MFAGIDNVIALGRAADFYAVAIVVNHVDVVDRQHRPRAGDHQIGGVLQSDRSARRPFLYRNDLIVSILRYRSDRSRRAEQSIILIEVENDVVARRVAEQEQITVVRAVNRIVALACLDRSIFAAVGDEIGLARTADFLIVLIVGNVIDIPDGELFAVLLKIVNARALERHRTYHIAGFDINDIIIADALSRTDRARVDVKRIVLAEPEDQIFAARRTERYHLCIIRKIDGIIVACAVDCRLISGVDDVIAPGLARHLLLICLIGNDVDVVEDKVLAALLDKIGVSADALECHRSRRRCLTHRNDQIIAVLTEYRRIN